jgi:demethylmenaquinone methyltransferase/2-methoxy-6-polyprenyl-1,4-benzoquinol methylase
MPSEDKATYIQNLFGRIAANYDQINDLMTLFLHRHWKYLSIQHASQGFCRELSSPKVLDLCTGTGDMAFLWAKHFKTVDISGIDSCLPMLESARQKLRTKSLEIQERLRFAEADALNLDFDDNSFDAVSVGFGLRNLSDLDRGLREIKRVLKPGAFIASLDLGHPDIALINYLHKNFFLKLLPVLGSQCAKDKEAYQYLIDSLESWPKQEALSQTFWNLGFKRSYYQNLAFGTVAIVVAEK